MEIHRFVVGQLQTNCYLLVRSQTHQAAIIDPGDEGDFLSEKILQLKISPQMILLTHGHFDHCLAAEELRLNFEIPVFVHKSDFPLLKNIKKSAFHWLPYLQGKEKILIPQKVKPLKVGESIKFGQEKLTVIHTPGHTPGSVSFHSAKEKLLFCGDLLFKDGVGRTDFSYSSSAKLEESIKKIYSLPSKTLIYPGHGQEFILKKLAIFPLISPNFP